MLISSLGSSAAAAEQLFRIATGAQGATYYPIAKAMANALSEPGVLKVDVVATSGSTANLNAIASGQLESGFSQADVAAWHVSGTGMVRPQFKLDKLRLMANLYPEYIHVVARKSLGLQSIAQLEGLRVAVGEPGSGVLVNARQILRAHGLTERDFNPVYASSPTAAARMNAGTLDALFFVGGIPARFISELANTTDIALLPVDGTALHAMRAAGPFYEPCTIEAKVYKRPDATDTIAIGAQWVTSSDADPDLVYRLLKRLFSPAVLAQVRASHPDAVQLSPTMGVLNASMALHPGAEKFYREIGALK